MCVAFYYLRGAVRRAVVNNEALPILMRLLDDTGQRLPEQRCMIEGRYYYGDERRLRPSVSITLRLDVMHSSGPSLSRSGNELCVRRDWCGNVRASGGAKGLPSSARVRGGRRNVVQGLKPNTRCRYVDLDAPSGRKSRPHSDARACRATRRGWSVGRKTTRRSLVQGSGARCGPVAPRGCTATL